jgi:hypothetical protein
MAYLGEHLYHCPRVPYNWRQTQVIVVSGDGPNFCGHALLSAGDYYFHIDGRNDRPFYLNEAGYRRFLKENNKREIQRKWIPLRDPDGAQKRLEELSVKNWRFYVVLAQLRSLHRRNSQGWRLKSPQPAQLSSY